MSADDFSRVVQRQRCNEAKLTAEVERLRAENDDLHDDLIRMMRERREIALAVCAHFMPGPDGQDYLDRAEVVDKIISEAFDEGRDTVDDYERKTIVAVQRMAAAESERDALRSVVRKAVETHPLEASSNGRTCWVRTVTAADGIPSLLVVTFTEAEHAAIDAAQEADQ